MAIKPPPYCKNAEPTPIGWRDPRTREILAVRKISQADIDEYYLSQMDKDALEAKAREHGMRLLREDGWLKVRRGETTIDEVLTCTAV